MHLYDIYYDRTRESWPFNTGDCLIEVTSCTCLTVLVLYQGVIPNILVHKRNTWLKLVLFYFHIYILLPLETRRLHSWLKLVLFHFHTTSTGDNAFYMTSSFFIFFFLFFFYFHTTSAPIIDGVFYMTKVVILSSLFWYFILLTLETRQDDNKSNI